MQGMITAAKNETKTIISHPGPDVRRYKDRCCCVFACSLSKADSDSVLTSLNQVSQPLITADHLMLAAIVISVFIAAFQVDLDSSTCSRRDPLGICGMGFYGLDAILRLPVM